MNEKYVIPKSFMGTAFPAKLVGTFALDGFEQPFPKSLSELLHLFAVLLYYIFENFV